MRKIDTIIIHHSASPAKTTTPADIEKWHLEKGFSDIGYHYMIDNNGEIHKGRLEKTIGAHCKGGNRNSIGICVFGDFEKEIASPKAFSTLIDLTENISLRYKIKKILPHLSLGKTKCPGKNMINDVNLLKINF